MGRDRPEQVDRLAAGPGQRDLDESAYRLQRSRSGGESRWFRPGDDRLRLPTETTLSLAGDADATRGTPSIDARTEPVILVGRYSYGGAVISEAGTHPKM